MELKEGMYVRTKEGEVKKVFQYDEQENNCLWCTLNCYVILKNSIVKASYNIIDLIEVGDYVNGYKVYSGGKNHFDYIVTWDEERNYYMKIELPSIDIKSIVTKEQFASVKYEVE